MTSKSVVDKFFVRHIFKISFLLFYYHLNVFIYCRIHLDESHATSKHR